VREGTFKMNKIASLVAFCFMAFCSMAWGNSAVKSMTGDEEPFKKGFTYLKWGWQFPEHAERSFKALKETGAEWVGFVPIYYMDAVDSTVVYRHPVLSPTDEELVSAIRTARKYGFKIMLKPHIDVIRDDWKSDWPVNHGGSREPWLARYRAFIDRYPVSFEGPENEKNWMRRMFSWRGDIKPSGEAAIKRWFAGYTRYILGFAHMAASEGAELFCAGTELEKLAHRNTDWKKVILEIKKIYKGPLFYDANHDGVEKAGFWNLLDYIGISAYYPAAARLDPSEYEIRSMLGAALNKLEKTVASLERKHGRIFKVLFGEAGYTDFRGTTKEPWNFMLTNGISEAEQALAYKVSLELYSKKEWLKGVFFWRWNVEPEDTYFEYDHYSPYRKTAEEEIIRAWRNR